MVHSVLSSQAGRGFVAFKEVLGLLYSRHLCRGVYSFRLSICLFIHSYVRSFVIPSSSWNYLKFYVKVS